MRNIRISIRFAPLALALVGLLGLAHTASAQFGSATFKVSITNLTKGQIMSPALVATHNAGAEPLFSVGSPASDELAQVAEDAVLGPLMAKLEASAGVMDVQVITGAAGPIMPGETASVEIGSLGQFNLVSLVSMLVTTNDAFAGLNAVRGPNFGTGVHRVVAYDAGSEANTEACTDIPGPPCGNAEVRVTDGAEGYVYISNGVYGGADLDPAMHDWRNPVAQISIERLP